MNWWLIGFWDQKVKGQGRSMTKYATNTIFGICFRDTFSMQWWISSKLLSLVHLRTQKVKGQGHQAEAYRAECCALTCKFNDILLFAIIMH